MDMLDALEHRTRFDEFIVMSGDADFTPVFLRLRAHDRRTVAMVSTPVAAAYRSACDLLIAEEAFVEQALGIEEEWPERAPPQLASPALLARMAEQLAQAVRARGPVPATALGQLYQEFPEFTRDSNWLGHFSLRALTTAIVAARTDLQMSEGPAWSVGLAPEAAAEPAQAAPEASLKPRVVETLRALVRGSDAPVLMARAAQHVIRELGPVVTESGWLGAGSFGALLGRCSDLGLEVFTRSPGYLWDPARHEPPRVEALPEARADLPDTLASLIRRVHTLTDAPGLTPAQYRGLFQVIARELQAGGYELNATGKAIRDHCAGAGQPLSRATVSFVLKGIGFGGHALSGPPECHTEQALAEAFLRNVEGLLEQAQAVLSAEEVSLLRAWLLAEEPAPGDAPAPPAEGPPGATAVEQGLPAAAPV
jgi:hypothetical protein